MKLLLLWILNQKDFYKIHLKLFIKKGNTLDNFQICIETTQRHLVVRNIRHAVADIPNHLILNEIYRFYGVPTHPKRPVGQLIRRYTEGVGLVIIGNGRRVSEATCKE